MNFMKIRHAFKASQCNLTCNHMTLNTLEWKCERILVKYMEVYIGWSRHLLFSVFEVLFTHFCYSNYIVKWWDGNPLFLTGPLQPWQTLTLLSQRLTKVIRTSWQVTSRIAFVKFMRGLIFPKKPFQFYGFFCGEYFSKIREIARR